MDILEFKDALLDLGIEVTPIALERLDKYYELLIEWNEKINLTAITLKKQVYLKHFYDSLTLVKCLNLNSDISLCDLGTGAGFPGVVLKIFFPDLKLTLVDALNKRIKFLSDVVSKLGLKDVCLVHARAEEFALKNRDCFDVVTARAVASLPILLEYSLPMVKLHGYFIAMKGDKEEDAFNALSILGGEIVQTEKFILPYEESKRMIIKVKKIKNSPTKYPRKFSEIKKKPL